MSVDAHAIPMLGTAKTWSEKYGKPAVVGDVAAVSAALSTQSSRTGATSQVSDGVEPEEADDAAGAEAVPDGESPNLDKAQSNPEDVLEAGPSTASAEPLVSTEPRATGDQAPSPFRLPPFASPFLFVPPNLEVSFRLTSFVYLRAPTCGPGYSEIPTPWDAEGEVSKLTWEWYTKHGQGKRIRRERKDSERSRRERSNPLAEVYFRQASAGGRVGQGGAAPRPTRIGAPPRGPHGDPHRLASLRL